jgi:hypothetical protein
MKRPKHMRAQMGSLMKSCAEAAEKAGFDAIRRVVRRMDQAKQDGRGQKVVEAISQGTERLIAKSPVPIPGPVQDALERMREALGQLSQSIDTVNAGASSLARDQPGQDPSRRQAMDDARAAFVDLEVNDEAEADAAGKKPRRHRSRRNSHHRQAGQADDQQSTQSSKKDRADQTPNS